jgi:glycosyltransferase involved in cell wall biosynthesis
LLKTRPAAIILFITTDQKAIILEEARRMSIPEANLLIYTATRQEVPFYLRLSQYNLFFIRPTFSKKASAATKMGEALAMGIPVITNSGWGDVDEIVEKENCGLVMAALKEDYFDQQVKKLIDRSFTREQCRSVALKYYQLNNGVAAYAGIYEQVVGQKTVPKKFVK